MRSFSVRYIILFSIALCAVCAVMVSTLAVSLADKQEVNQTIDRKRNVLMAAGRLDPGAKATAAEIEELFSTFEPVVIDLRTGEELPDVDPMTFDQQVEKKDPDNSREAPANTAGVNRLPYRGLVYKAFDGDRLELIVLPVEGYGLWSTLYGYLALESDFDTIAGLAYYNHAETPGLGGEVDNPRWRQLWPGRKAFGDDWEPAISVIKGAAGPVEDDPYNVDGLSGATITARGVDGMMKLWLGPDGFGPYLQNLSADDVAASPDSAPEQAAAA
ncbi:MAG: Na(+)-translocating NADH-quinone reductase subunit C [Acidobacteriota bacterium]